MSTPKVPRQRPPLDESRLQELALRYVGRFATTRAKLAAYLRRKVRERGWSGEREPGIEGLVERFRSQGYIDDAGFALSKSQALSGRGYGKSRLVQSLRIAGVEEEDSEAARAFADAEAVKAAIRFARRKRVGPFAASEPDRKARERALSAMVRAGHSFALSRAIVDIEPGGDIPEDALSEFSRHGSD